jgi:mRNA-degrading endonuclease RelE of RelBE toxin-antitoxin system
MTPGLLEEVGGMVAFVIEVTEEAKDDLDFYPAAERKTLASDIRDQLSYQPLVETRNRKQLRDNPLARWELRSGKFRIFYEVNESARSVAIVSVGHKEHNKLFIRGKEVKI